MGTASNSALHRVAASRTNSGSYVLAVRCPLAVVLSLVASAH